MWDRQEQVLTTVLRQSGETSGWGGRKQGFSFRFSIFCVHILMLLLLVSVVDDDGGILLCRATGWGCGRKIQSHEC